MLHTLWFCPKSSLNQIQHLCDQNSPSGQWLPRRHPMHGRRPAESGWPFGRPHCRLARIVFRPHYCQRLYEIRNNWKYKHIFQGTTIQFLPVWTAIKPDISKNTKLLITVPLKPALCFFLSWSLCVYPSGMAERFEWVGVLCIFEKSPNPLERLYYTQHMLYMLFVWNAFNSRAAMNAKIKNTSQAASCKIKICYICI